MSFAFLPSLLWPLSVAIAVFLAIVACRAVTHFKAQRKQRQVTLLNTTIRDYFRHSGVEVSVDSISLGKDARFTAFVESEPMKRFRLSHIIEMTLRAHVAKTCNLELDKIYWRFPIKEVAAPAPGIDKPAAREKDDYINEGLVTYRHLPTVDVQEISWEKFEEFTTADPNAAPRTQPPGQPR